MKYIFLPITALLIVGCANPATTTPVSNHNNQLTHGNVQLKLINGKTTQTEVLESFGGPNVTSIDSDGNEVWTYQRQATNAQGAVENWSIFGRDTTVGFSQSQRTITLIIKFDASKIVKDFRSRSSSF